MQENPLQLAWERGAQAFGRRAQARQRRRRRRRIAAAYLAAVLLLGSAAWVLLLRGNDEPPPTERVVRPTISVDPPSPPVAATTCRTPLDPDNPLRIWIGGDSLAGSLGPALGELAADTGVAQPTYDYHSSSGLSTPGFFNWAERAIDEMARVNPEIVVFIIGANDAGTVRSTELTEFGEVAWRASYAQHVNEMLDYFSAAGRAVYWVGSPTLRAQNVEVAQINEVAREIVEQRDGATYVDAFQLFSANGEYTATLPGTDGNDVRVRTPDGVHFSTAGGDLLAKYVFAYIDQQCALEDQAVPGEKQPVRQSPGSGVVPGKGTGTAPTNPPTTASSTPETTPPTPSSTSASASTSTSSTSQTTSSTLMP